jgi:hypothetical protein
VYAAISSLSFSLLAAAIDAIFDLGSNALLFWLHKKASRLDVNKWPVGGARLETIGNIVYGTFLFYHWEHNTDFICHSKVFCMYFSSFHLRLPVLRQRGCRMGSVNLVIIVESARSLITRGNGDLKAFHVPSVVGVGVALGNHFISHLAYTKSCLFHAGVKILLFLYCYSLRSKSSQVEVIWEDHRNDVVLNGFGTAFAHLYVASLISKTHESRYPHVGWWQ